MDILSELKIFGEILAAVVLGGIIGIEREIADKPAGFRTHMLVAASSCFLVGSGQWILREFYLEGYESYIRADPTRIIQALIVGLTFLGAGTIIQRTKTETVEGLTTAASLLLTGIIGMSVAVEKYIIAVLVTGLSLFILRGVGFVERWATSKRRQVKKRMNDMMNHE